MCEENDKLEPAEDSERKAHLDDVTAIRASIQDMEKGDIGRPANEHVQELREKLTSLLSNE